LSFDLAAAGPEIVLLAFLLVGIGLMAVGGRFLRASRRATAGHTRARGTVVRMAQGPDYDDGEFPVIAFAPAGGPVIEFEATVGGRFFGYAPGKSVEVLFDPGDPSKAVVAGAEASFLWAVIGFGAIWTAAVVAFGRFVMFAP
jgi:hypothetical protein